MAFNLSRGRNSGQVVVDTQPEPKSASDFLMSSAHQRLAKALATGVCFHKNRL